jgi:hypothetical protein
MNQEARLGRVRELRQRAAEKCRSKVVRILLVAEAPPAGHQRWAR